MGFIQATSHGVHDRLWLLEDFLLHEVVEATLHDLLQFQLNGLNSADVGGSIVLVQTMNVQLAFVNVGNVIIFEIENLLGVLDDRRGIGGQEEFCWLRNTIIREESTGLGPVEQRFVRRSKKTRSGLLDCDILRGLLRGKRLVLRIFNVDKVHLHLPRGPHTDDEGRSLAGRNDLMGEVNRLNKETKSTLELLHDSLCEDSEVNLWLLVEEILGKLSNALGVGLRFKAEALALQQSSEFFVVGDDTIVDNGEFPAQVRPVR